MIQEAVATAGAFVVAEAAPDGALPPGRWAVAEAAARIDIAGGWTDTPPISYEHGGAVTNLAIKLNGSRPIGARVCVTDQPTLVFQYGGEELQAARVSSTALLDPATAPPGTTVVVCDELEQLSDYCAPSAPAALLKAAVLCAGLVELPAATDDDDGGVAAADEGAEAEAEAAALPSLAAQLEAALGGNGKGPGRGLHIVTWSLLPTGSGLGTSSILAAALLRALCVAAGRPYSDSSLTHAVLKLEQMLTTGGGWQDQVGGIYPGAKIARSPAALPLQVTTTPIVLAPAVVELLNDHLLMIFTGRPRLARNLLQVKRRCCVYPRLPAKAPPRSRRQSASSQARCCCFFFLLLVFFCAALLLTDAFFCPSLRLSPCRSSSAAGTRGCPRSPRPRTGSPPTRRLPSRPSREAAFPPSAAASRPTGRRRSAWPRGVSPPSSPL
jgi:fucokinase